MMLSNLSSLNYLYIFFGEMSIQAHCSFFNQVVLSYLNSLCILDINPPIRHMVWKYSLSFNRLFLHSIDWFLGVVFFFFFLVVFCLFSFCFSLLCSSIFIWSNINCLCFWCHIHETNAKTNVKIIFPCFHLVLQLQVLDLYNPFWVDICIWCEIKAQFHFSAWRYPAFPVLFIEEVLLSPLCILGTLSKISWQ